MPGSNEVGMAPQRRQSNPSVVFQATKRGKKQPRACVAVSTAGKHGGPALERGHPTPLDDSGPPGLEVKCSFGSSELHGHGGICRLALFCQLKISTF